MPIYEFECQGCHEVTEKICSYAEAAALEGSLCEKCSEGQIRKKASVPALKFVGPGFYETEYARKDRENARIRNDLDKARVNIDEQEREKKKRFGP